MTEPATIDHAPILTTEQELAKRWRRAEAFRESVGRRIWVLGGLRTAPERTEQPAKASARPFRAHDYGF